MKDLDQYQNDIKAAIAMKVVQYIMNRTDKDHARGRSESGHDYVITKLMITQTMISVAHTSEHTSGKALTWGRGTGFCLRRAGSAH
eukprot:scaffold89549_cov35-Prasinocladus_malaysianus.AAC.1